MRETLDFIRDYDVYFILGVAAISLFLLIYTIVLSRGLASLRKRYGAKLADGSVGEIVDNLTEHANAIADLNARHDDTKSKQIEHSVVLAGCVQRMGMVRFNAFDDVGGEQSFALVLLDANGNGIALSSLYGRQDSRVYAKSIANGEGERPLSDEERSALNMALSGAGADARVKSTSTR